MKLLLNVLMSATLAYTWNYAQHGEDWGLAFATCKTGPQSPLDLPFNLPGMGDIRWA